MIFKQNLPPSYILDFYFKVRRITGSDTVVYCDISTFPGLLSLLETCKISNDTVYRAGFKKVEVILPGANDSSVERIWAKGSDGDNNLYYFKVQTERFNYSYMRPSVDVLLVCATEFAQLHKIGGSIGLLSSLSHIAINGFKYIFADDPAEVSKHFAALFETIGKNCQALEKVSMVMGHGVLEFWGTRRESAKSRRLLPLDGDFSSFHLVEDPSTTRRTDLFGEPESLITMWNANAGLLMEELRKYVKTTEPEEPDVVEYWSKVKVVPTLMSWLEGKDEPRLWVPALRSLIACHEDGTPLDRYKGMAQIFDGAKW
ncbi:hypothetical protein DSL72_006860 [Monilinia vaccinii-corymbosi]|uniref:Uncharacterized protein n=1 Tax=Monilinia vaccinii-corymbosi TaxID=61207 RepID=A0A8A3PK86_9HELO|nr:hypothetical protein DSL72_006860 [Monilinia vaccinii-corymbosi]